MSSSDASGGTYEACLSTLTADNATESPTAEALLQCITSTYDASIDSTNASVDAFFLLYAASLVFFMQTGFAMIAAGCVKINNVQNTLLKNLLDACGASLGFYTVGYAFAFGGSDPNDPNAETTFIGTENFFLMDVPNDSFWLFQFAFCATSATIVAGTLAERCQMTAYLLYSTFLAAFVYPVVVHSIWSPNGFLSASNPNPLWGVGTVDFAGSLVVHLTGGMTALIATKILGPRSGRFFDLRGKPLEEPLDMPGHSVALQCLGTFILWFGWYGFNAGSILLVTPPGNDLVISHTAICTTLSAASGCIMTLFISTIIKEHFTGEFTFNLQYAMNGCLSGLVAITAGCSVVESWASVVIGLVAGGIYLLFSHYLVKKRVDDAVDAIPVHMLNGIWGAIAVGLFAEPNLMESVYGQSEKVGWFYMWGRGSGDGTLLACQLIGILWVVGWVLGMMTPFFWALHYFGYLRSDSLEEVVGLDIGYTGGFHQQARRYSLNNELEGKMDDYMAEYEHRKRERAYVRKNAHPVKKILDKSPLPASSLHNESLHGNSYHGRKVITSNMIESLDATAPNSSSRALDSSQGRSSLDGSRGSRVSASPTMARVSEDFHDQEKAT